MQCPTLGRLVERDLEASRMKLVDLVVHFCSRSDDRAVIVFDGRQKSHSPQEDACSTAHVQVMFSSGGRSADAVIERMVYESRHQHGEIVVVSGDREIRELCRTLGALVISPGTFMGLVHDAQKRLSQECSPSTALPRKKYSMQDVLSEKSALRLKAIRRKLEQGH